MNQLKSTYRSLFPPIYRRDYRLIDVLRVLGRRLLVLFGSTSVLLGIAFVLWQITPKTLLSYQDWRLFLLRLGGVSVVAYLSFVLVRMYHSTLKPRPKLKGSEKEEVEQEEHNLFTKAIAAAIGASAILEQAVSHAHSWPAEQLPEERALNRLIMEIAEILHDRESIPFLVGIQTTNPKLLNRAMFLGFNVMRLFSDAGFVLLLSGSENKKPLLDEDRSTIDKAIQEFKPRTYMLGSGEPSASESPSFLVELVAPKTADSQDERLDADRLIDWLASVGIRVCPKGEARRHFVFLESGIILTERRKP